jgi:hypothetical protein
MLNNERARRSLPNANPQSRSTPRPTASTSATRTQKTATAASTSSKTTSATVTRNKGPADKFEVKFFKELQNLRLQIMSQNNIKNATSILSDTSLKHVVSKFFRK